MIYRKHAIFIIFLLYAIVTTSLSGKYFALYFLFSVIVLIIIYIIIYTHKIFPKVDSPANTVNEIITAVSDTFESTYIDLQPLVESTLKESDTEKQFQKLFSGLSKDLNIYNGISFVKNGIDGQFRFASQYAMFSEELPQPFQSGEGLHGQVAQNKKIAIVGELSHRVIISGLGKCNPKSIAIIPIINKTNETWAVLELAFLNEITPPQTDALNFLMNNFKYQS